MVGGVVTSCSYDRYSIEYSYDKSYHMIRYVVVEISAHRITGLKAGQPHAQPHSKQVR